MRSVLALVSLLAMMPAFSAETTVKCEIDGDVLGPQMVSWNSDTGVADIYLEDGHHRSVVTRTQMRETGHKVNLMFKGIGEDAETEFMVFPTMGGHMIVGVGYDYADGQRYLSTSQGHFQATCENLPRNSALFGS